MAVRRWRRGAGVSAHGQVGRSPRQLTVGGQRRRRVWRWLSGGVATHHACRRPSPAMHMLYAATRSKMGFRRWGLDAACDICTLRVFAQCGAKKSPKRHICTLRVFAPEQKKRERAKRGMSSTGLRLATATSALAALRLLHEHTRRAHACRARSSRTHHACAPRQPCTCSTRQHSAKAWLPCSSHWPLAARRPARRWHIWRECALQTRSPPPLRDPMHRRHAVHAINLHRCTLPPYAES